MQKWQAVLVLILFNCHSGYCGAFNMCTKGCYRPNEEKFRCAGTNNGENVCPGVHPRLCNKGQDICRCSSQSFLRNDELCVKERDCVPRANNFEQFIASSGPFYAVFISNGVSLDFPIKCLASTVKSSINNRINVGVRYREMIGRISEVKFVTGDNGKPRAEWSAPREQWLTKSYEVTLERHNDVLRRNLDELSSLTRSTWTVFRILHADDQCLILGEAVPAESSTTPCIMWVRKSSFGNISHGCSYIFQRFCNSPQVSVTSFDEWCDQDISKRGPSSSK
uniref:TIL domain-containing protein n=1 Tax=Amblyomma maculatum TaxID=34609 RepID=G3MKB9_AMBMU